MLVYSKKTDLVFLRDSPALKPLTPGEVARLCRDGEGNYMPKHSAKHFNPTDFSLTLESTSLA